MSTPLTPQEIFLLERYSSVDYFAEMRDAWHNMVQHAEKCLSAFERALPADYRRRPLPEQPDIVWGETVLVNFRDTAAGLDDAFIRLTHGDLAALSYSNGVHNDFVGLKRDYSAEWMDEPAVSRLFPNAADKFYVYLHEAASLASNIQATFDAHWRTGALAKRFNAAVRGPLNPPSQWPTYRLTPQVTAVTNQIVSRSGIYLPDCNESCAALLIEGKPAPLASVGYNPQTTQCLQEVPTRWTLVERASDAGGGSPGASDPFAAGIRLRCAAGQPCPNTGWWFTPARTDSRRRFNAGELMPDVGGDYGATIWQWDERQA